MRNVGKISSYSHECIRLSETFLHNLTFTSFGKVVVLSRYNKNIAYQTYLLFFWSNCMWRANVYRVGYNLAFRRLYAELLFRSIICEYFKICAVIGTELLTFRVFLFSPYSNCRSYNKINKIYRGKHSSENGNLFNFRQSVFTKYISGMASDENVVRLFVVCDYRSLGY